LIRTIARTYRAAYSGLPRECWLLFCTLLVNRAGGMVLPFVTLYLTQARGLSVAAAGRILAVYGIGAIAGSFLGGWLSDRIGATRTQQVSLFASAVGYLVLAERTEPREIAVAVFLLSIVVEAYRPAAMTDMAERAPEPLQARAFALLRLAANIGAGIGPVAGGFLALHSYRWLFWADGATCLLAGLLLAATLGRGGAAAREQEGGPRRRGPSPWRDGPFLLLLTLVVLLAAAFFQIFSTVPLYYKQRYLFREDTIGLLLGLNALLIILFEMVLIHWAERRNRLLLSGLGAFLVCAGFALMPLGSSPAFVTLTIVVWTLGEMLSLPLLNAVVASRAARGNRGRYMGLYATAFSFAFVFAPACGTWVYQHRGPDTLWHAMWLAGAVMWIWAAALIRAFRGRPAGRPD
jgi:predicted MFS family arabinose efflux permease